MKTLLSLILSALTLAAQGLDEPAFVASLTVTAAASACVCTGSGSFVSGDTERFEQGDGDFCLDGWTETDTSGILDSHNSAQSVTCGNSLSVSETANTAAYVLQSTSDDAASVRFYIRFDDVFGADTRYIYVFGAGQDANNYSVRVRPYQTGGGIRLDLTGVASSAGPALSQDTWYRVEVDCNRNTTSTMKVYSLGGAQVGSDVTVTARDYAQNTWLFGKQTGASFSSTYTFYIDNVKFQAAGGNIGADE